MQSEIKKTWVRFWLRHSRDFGGDSSRGGRNGYTTTSFMSRGLHSSMNSLHHDHHTSDSGKSFLRDHPRGRPDGRASSTPRVDETPNYEAIPMVQNQLKHGQDVSINQKQEFQLIQPNTPLLEETRFGSTTKHPIPSSFSLFLRMRPWKVFVSLHYSLARECVKYS